MKFSLFLKIFQYTSTLSTAVFRLLFCWLNNTGKKKNQISVEILANGLCEGMQIKFCIEKKTEKKRRVGIKYFHTTTSFRKNKKNILTSFVIYDMDEMEKHTYSKNFHHFLCVLWFIFISLRIVVVTRRKRIHSPKTKSIYHCHTI